jgi:tetrahydromethanopterin S-methyltransferase subunit F
LLVLSQIWLDSCVHSNRISGFAVGKANTLKDT